MQDCLLHTHVLQLWERLDIFAQIKKQKSNFNIIIKKIKS